MLQYILEVTLCWTLFYAIFFALLRKVTFYRVNRWYLLGALVAGILIPLLSFIDLNLHQEQVAQAAPLVYVVKEAPAYIANTVIEQTIDWQYIIQYALLGLYMIGLTFFLLRFLKGLRTILSLYNQGSKTHHDHHTVVNTTQSHLPFSFLNIVFISDKLPLKGDIQDILKHELAHVKSRHSLDVLLLEIINIAFWFHPLVYLYKTAIRQTHEYLADAVVLESTSRKIYGNILLKQSLSGLEVALAHHFFHSHIKKRINMMYQKKSGQSAWLKYSLALPILVLLFVVFSGYQSQEAYTTDDLFEEWGMQEGSMSYSANPSILYNNEEASLKYNDCGTRLVMTERFKNAINSYDLKQNFLIVIDGEIIKDNVSDYLSTNSIIQLENLSIHNPFRAKQLYGRIGKYGALVLKFEHIKKLTQFEQFEKMPDFPKMSTIIDETDPDKVPLLYVDDVLLDLPLSRHFSLDSDFSTTKSIWSNPNRAIEIYGDKGKNGALQLYGLKFNSQENGFFEEYLTNGIPVLYDGKSKSFSSTQEELKFRSQYNSIEVLTERAAIDKIVGPKSEASVVSNYFNNDKGQIVRINKKSHDIVDKETFVWNLQLDKSDDKINIRVENRKGILYPSFKFHGDEDLNTFAITTPEGSCDNEAMMDLFSCIDETDQTKVPLIFIDDKELVLPLSNYIDQSNKIEIETIEWWCPEQAKEKYGERGKNGVVKLYRISQGEQANKIKNPSANSQIEYNRFRKPPHTSFNINNVYTWRPFDEIRIFDLGVRNIPQGLLSVNAGIIKLKEGKDYEANYSSGEIRIINSEYLEKVTAISIQLKNKKLTATDFIYNYGKETPLINKAKSFEESQSIIRKYIKDNIQLPSKAPKGKTYTFDYAMFIVEKDGSISDMKTAVIGQLPSVKEETLRVVRKMSDELGWQPGRNNGVVKRVGCIVPVQFFWHAQKEDDKGTKKKNNQIEFVPNRIIELGTTGIPAGSLTVKAGDNHLKESIDYTVDYSSGRLKIINNEYLNKNTTIKVSFSDKALQAKGSISNSIVLYADTLEWDGSSDILKLTGDVSIKDDGNSISADKIDYFQTKSEKENRNFLKLIKENSNITPASLYRRIASPGEHIIDLNSLGSETSLFNLFKAIERAKNRANTDTNNSVESAIIQKESLAVTANNSLLKVNTDYTVDFKTGLLIITNPKYKNQDTLITVTFVYKNNNGEGINRKSKDNSQSTITMTDKSGNMVIGKADKVDLTINNDTLPLFVINGVVKGKVTEPMIDLKAEDIKHINVLKGEAAIKKYGDQASDGVVEVYTKEYEKVIQESLIVVNNSVYLHGQAFLNDFKPEKSMDLTVLKGPGMVTHITSKKKSKEVNFASDTREISIEKRKGLSVVTIHQKDGNSLFLKAKEIHISETEGLGTSNNLAVSLKPESIEYDTTVIYDPETFTEAMMIEPSKEKTRYVIPTNTLQRAKAEAPTVPQGDTIVTMHFDPEKSTYTELQVFNNKAGGLDTLIKRTTLEERYNNMRPHERVRSSMVNQVLSFRSNQKPNRKLTFDDSEVSLKGHIDLSDALIVKYTSPTKGSVTFYVHDLLGKLIEKRSLSYQDAHSGQQFQLSKDITGVVIITSQQGDKIRSEKVLIAK